MPILCYNSIIIWEQKHMRKTDIEFKKQMSSLMHKAEQAAKPPFCLFCGEESSLCNSHTVPRFILKHIDEKGMVCYGYSLVNYLDNLIDTKKGINNAFNYYLICRDCDQKQFAHYEKPESILDYDHLDDKTKNIVLIEMALKTHLAHMFRKAQTYNMNSMLFPDVYKKFQETRHKTAYEIDIEDHRRYLIDLLCAKEDASIEFEVLYNKLLDYEVGIATQTIIAYIYDLQGNILFNPHYYSTADSTKYFYLVILPIEGKTRILFYIEKQYVPIVKNIVEQFNALTEEEKLHFLFMSLIVYDEQFYINPILLKTIRKDKKLCKLFVQADSNRGLTKHCKKIKNLRKYNNYLLNKNPKDNMNDKTNN